MRSRKSTASGDLGAAACAAALYAFVTATVTNHDGSAGVACGRISHVDKSAHGVGSMDQTAVFHVQTGLRLTMAGMHLRQNSALRCRRCSHSTGRLMLLWHVRLFNFRGSRLRSQTGEQRQLRSGKEAQLQPAENVIHDGLGKADLLIAGPA